MLDDNSMMLSDEELEKLVNQIHSESPTIGVSMVRGRLFAMGYQVTRERIRRALRSADPLSSALRWTGRLSRRQPYCVAGPNSLWHIGKLHICIYKHVHVHVCHNMVIVF